VHSRGPCAPVCDTIDEQGRGTPVPSLAQEMGIMRQAFAYPFMYRVGMHTPPDAAPTAVAECSQFYSTIHLPEVVASNPGFVRGTRYEIFQPDPRGDWRPRYTSGPTVWQQAQDSHRCLPRCGARLRPRECWGGNCRSGGPKRPFAFPIGIFGLASCMCRMLKDR